MCWPEHPTGGSDFTYRKGYFKQEFDQQGWQQERDILNGIPAIICNYYQAKPSYPLKIGTLKFRPGYIKSSLTEGPNTVSGYWHTRKWRSGCLFHRSPLWSDQDAPGSRRLFSGRRCADLYEHWTFRSKKVSHEWRTCELTDGRTAQQLKSPPLITFCRTQCMEYFTGDWKLCIYDPYSGRSWPSSYDLVEKK